MLSDGQVIRRFSSKSLSIIINLSCLSPCYHLSVKLNFSTNFSSLQDSLRTILEIMIYKQFSTTNKNEMTNSALKFNELGLLKITARFFPGVTTLFSDLQVQTGSVGLRCCNFRIKV